MRYNAKRAWQEIQYKHRKEVDDMAETNVTKDAIVDAVASRTDMTKKDTEAMVEALLDEITVQMQKGNKVTFTGFGAFRVLKRAERMGINPKTKERIKIAAMKVPKFSAGKTLKEAVK